MLVIYGLLQERIMSVPYGDPGEDFTDSVFLVLCNRLVAVVFAFTMAVGHCEPLANKAPLWKYLAISFSSVYASTCQYEALKYVSFPVQMLGKSFKMMPVMVWGMVVASKRYGMSDWLVAFTVTGGVTEFLLTGPISSSSSEGTEMHGLLLLAGFLFLDGFTSTFQERLFKEHKTSKYNQMVYINLGSAIISSTTLTASGRMGSAVAFSRAHPAFLLDAGMLSAAAVGAQWFIYSQVKEFGALVFAATMNVRQVVSILVSYSTYGHSITYLQVIGLLLVFGALFYQSIRNLLEAEEQKPQEETKPLLKKEDTAATAGAKV